MRLDRELGDHRERVRPLDDDVGRGGIDIAPAVVVLVEDVGARQLVARPEARVLDERRRRVEGGGDREDRRQLLALDPHPASALLGRVEGLRGDDGDGLAVVVRLAGREDGPILPLRTESRHGLRQVGRGHDEPDAGDGEGGARVDRDDPGSGAVEPHELGVENALEAEVRHVGLAAGDPIVATDPGRRRADAVRPHDPTASTGPPAASTASMICS